MSKIKEATEALLNGKVDINELLQKVENDPEVQLNDILEKLCPQIKGNKDEKELQMNIDSCFLSRDLEMKAYMVGFLCGKLYSKYNFEKVIFENPKFEQGFTHGMY